MDYALRMIRTADFVRLRVILRVVVGRNIKKSNHRKTVNHMDNYYQNYGTNNNDNDSSEEEGYLFGLEFGENSQANINSVKSKQPRLNVKVNGLNVQMLVDTGSSINIFDENTYQKSR